MYDSWQYLQTLWKTNALKRGTLYQKR